MKFTYRSLAHAITLVSLTPLVSAPAFAAQEPMSNEVHRIQSSVITATRIETPLKDVVGDVTVISEDEIAQHTGQSLFEILQSQPSIQFKSNGGMGQTSSIFIRGASASRVMLLVDGVRTVSISDGAGTLSAIPADSIKRIEILYGSSATSVYGSDALGGVIQVFTKAGTSAKNNGYVNLSVGTHNTKAISAGVNLAQNETRFGVNVNLQKTDSISASNESSGAYTFEADKDAHDIKSLNFSASHKQSDVLELGVSMLASDSETQFDAGSADNSTTSYTDTHTKRVWSKHLLGNVSVKTHYGVSKENKEYPTWNSIYNTKSTEGSLDITYNLPVGKAVAGYQYTKQKLTWSAATQPERTINSYLLGYQFAEDFVQGQVNLRHDDIQNYDTKNSYSVGLALLPIEGFRVGASYATGVKLPTFNDLYSPYGSNPDVQEENAKNTELFFEIDHDSLVSRVSIFNNKRKDMIALDANWIPQNIAQATLQGASVKTSYKKDGYDFGFYYDHLNAQDEQLNKQLIYRAKNSAGAHAGYTGKKWSVKGELHHVGKRYTDAQNTHSLKPYSTSNIAVGYKASAILDINLRVNNLFDKQYTTSKGYNTIGRNALLSVNLHTQ